MTKIVRLIYPRIRHDVMWHRIVLVVGWILSIISLALFPIIFVLYFSIGQRLIFFVVYGKDKSKWQIPEPE